MKKIKKRGEVVVIDKSLEKYKNLILNPDKLKRANEILRKAGVPKI